MNEIIFMKQLIVWASCFGMILCLLAVCTHTYLYFFMGMVLIQMKTIVKGFLGIQSTRHF